MKQRWISTCSGWFQQRGGILPAYLGSVLVVGAASCLTAILSPLNATPTVLFFAAVAVSAWLGGKGPAFLAALLSVLLVDFLFVYPQYSLLADLADLVRLGAFLLVAFLVCSLQEGYQRIAARLREANDILETRVRDRTAQLTDANQSLTAEIEERRRTESALTQSEARLRTTLQEKELLLRELHHRVKNNLQIITSLLSLQGSKIQDPNGKELFKECQQRVRAIALIHDRLYRTPNLANFDLATYLEDLVQNLLRSYAVNTGTIVPRIVVDNSAVGIDHLIPCALIVNELVCNALKYAFPDGRSGEVRVELQRRDDQVSLLVADDGVGDSSGAPRGNGVGKQIVLALVDQLSGTLEWANGRGASATVTFPETEKGKSHVNESYPRG